MSVKNSVTGVDVALSPMPGMESPGNLYTLPAGSYVVSEGVHAGYLAGYSGNCDPAGNITLVAGNNYIVTVTNNDIPVVVGSGGGGSSTVYPPLINIVKKPEPLALTSGSGSVTYTYKVTNPGRVSLSNVSVTDDKVSPVKYISGDTNSDNRLQTNETWIYTSQMTLNKTTTNTATAKGSANGLTAADIALATVVVTQPIVTPTVTGQLPEMGTPFYTLLLLGLVLAMVGIVVWRCKKRYE